MKQNFILFVVLTTLLISCKDTPKQKNKSVNSDTIDQKTTNIESEIADSSTGLPAVYFIKSEKILPTDELKKYLKEELDSVEKVDFTGDKIPDYICKTKIDSLGNGSEYWVSSEFKTIKKTKLAYGFHYRWFINLDSDPEPEIFDGIGEEDGADYVIKDQNLSTGKDITLLYVNPVIIENGKKYWGYPWDIKNIKAQKNGDNIELFCSLNHQIIRDGNEETDPKSQKQMPVIFFTGHHTQEFRAESCKDEQWLTLKEIIKRTKR